MIEWEDYAPEDNTWEEESCLLGNTELVEEFKQQLMKEFPERPNLSLSQDRVVLSGAYDPESSIPDSPEPTPTSTAVLPLTSKTNSKSNNKRPATDRPKSSSPRKTSRTEVTPEIEFGVPDKVIIAV